MFAAVRRSDYAVCRWQFLSRVRGGMSWSEKDQLLDRIIFGPRALLRRVMQDCTICVGKLQGSSHFIFNDTSLFCCMLIFTFRPMTHCTFVLSPFETCHLPKNHGLGQVFEERLDTLYCLSHLAWYSLSQRLHGKHKNQSRVVEIFVSCTTTTSSLDQVKKRILLPQ